MRFVIFSAFTLLWTAMWTWIYPCHVKGLCGQPDGSDDGADYRSVPESTLNLNEVFLFRWADAEPLKTPQFELYRAMLREELSKGKCLEITGLYFANESSTSETSEIGHARALNAVTELLGAMDSSIVSTRSVRHPSTENPLRAPFPALRFRLHRCDSLIIEYEDRIVIDSDLISNDEDFEEISDYMTELAGLLASEDLSVVILAHTDVVDQADGVNDRTLVHALSIRSKLVNGGLSASNIRLITRAWSDGDRNLQRELRGKIELRITKSNIQ